jgi:hypothetical protein
MPSMQLFVTKIVDNYLQPCFQAGFVVSAVDNPRFIKIEFLPIAQYSLGYVKVLSSYSKSFIDRCPFPNQSQYPFPLPLCQRLGLYQAEADSPLMQLFSSFSDKANLFHYSTKQGVPQINL